MCCQDPVWILTFTDAPAIVRSFSGIGGTVGGWGEREKLTDDEGEVKPGKVTLG